MASYQVNFSCGHRGNIALAGAYSERKRKIEYLEQNGRCSDCCRKEAAEMAAKKAEKSGAKIPELLEGAPRFNKTIYGSENYYSIYLDGKKEKITNEQAAEIREYLAKIER